MKKSKNNVVNNRKPNRSGKMGKNSGKLDDEAVSWVQACLDPYSDYQYDVRGLPDERTAPSVVQIHNQSETISIPTSASGGNWDASILYSGINSTINWDYTNYTGGFVTIASSSVMPYDHTAMNSIYQRFGACNIWCGAAGSTQVTGAPTTSGDTYRCLGSNLNTDRCRLIGVAIEIHNTTAEVYRQGTVTIAQLPDNAEDACNISYRDTAGTGTIQQHEAQADRCCIQASTVTPLQAVPGCSIWKAAEGCYVIPRMTKIPREIYSFAIGPGATGTRYGANSRSVIMYGTDGKTSAPYPTDYATSTNPTLSWPIWQPFAPSGFSPVQIYFTGLSPQTTLTLTFRTIVEYFPALNSALLPLAEPSPTFSPAAFALYSEVIRNAPIAVKVDENATGDYWRKILKLIGQALQLTSPMFGSYSPIAGAVGNVLNSKFQQY